MLRKFAFMFAPIVWAMCCQTATSADDSVRHDNGPASAAESFIDIFELGQSMTLRAQNVSGYQITLYSEVRREIIEKEYQAKLDEYEVAAADRRLVEAKDRELSAELHGAATPEERDRIITELRALGYRVFSDGRLAGLPRGLARPSQTRFYRVTKIGENFIQLSREDRLMYIPLWSIQSISQDLEPEEQAKAQRVN